MTSTGYAVAEGQRDDVPGKHGTASQEFDFETGNSPLEIVYPTVHQVVREDISPGAMDATIVLRIVTVLENGWFDAIAPYHKTAKGVHSDLGRRPASESRTEKKLNTAILYSSYHTLNSLLPKHSEVWREMLTSVGLDPDDASTDKTSPVGLGNLAGKAVVRARENDGMNQLGNEGGRKYHRKPYRDYTGYQPKNTPDRLRDPSRWQPDISTEDNGIYTAQRFVTPQMGRVDAYTFDNPAMFDVKPPKASNHHNRRAYKRQANEVLEVSAELNDEKKLKAEFFDDKLLFLGEGFPVDDSGGSVQELVESAFSIHIATFDTAIAVWHYKAKFDSVRPFSAIGHLYGKRPVTAWGGAGEGTVDDLPADQWRSYLATADHPEYPSATASICAAAGSVGKQYSGTDRMRVEFPVEKGSSEGEPGVVPAKDTTLRWNSWDKYVDDCGQSRMWGGVHFQDSITAGQKIGEQVSERAYDFVKKHVAGDRKGGRG
ncbi:vanadium-dependent haloperoxidase [Streptomyces sp. N2-109]|uniref:Vanadium-dependent haloperoxidase n=1 Tax=Streptomyces gossypii TaxID=2883101 RepID=A0ABT2JZE6_9ACTN|nr:vanadium-dependent haloperoxidase [Streptomyces gossypii]MCT2593270.1 vanadium-dependent haloperoxidase [Streptomyces gossypii]